MRYSILIAAAMAATALTTGARTRVSILGDSYSTFKGYTQPESNAQWYFADQDTARTDVMRVDQTWWHRLLRDKGYLLERNNSYSGSTISTTGYFGEDFTDRSFNTRVRDLGSPDIILIFGSTNDSWAHAPVGEFKYSGITKDDLTTYRPALANLLETAIARYPNTKIYFMIWDGNTPEIISSAETICSHYGIPLLIVKNIETKNGHPTVGGMESIARQAAAFIQQP